MNTPSSPDATVITGASSGIGLALCRHTLRSDAHSNVIAVARHATRCNALAELREQYRTRLLPMDCDITLDTDRQALSDALAGQTLRRVINCAGLLHDPDGSLAPEKRLEDLNADNLFRSFSVNAFAPVLLARDLLHHFPRHLPSVFASLSARVGSISDNGLGGWYAYRAAKAAQNQLLRTLAIEMRRRRPSLCVLLLHPGTTDTPLSRPFQRNVPDQKLFHPDWVAERLAGLIDNANSDDSGRFIAWDGKDIPW